MQERLDALAQLEKAGAGKAGAAGQEEEGEGGAEAEEELHDTDEEEDMENDDYYKVRGYVWVGSGSRLGGRRLRHAVAPHAQGTCQPGRWMLWSCFAHVRAAAA